MSHLYPAAPPVREALNEQVVRGPTLRWDRLIEAITVIRQVCG